MGLARILAKTMRHTGLSQHPVQLFDTLIQVNRLNVPVGGAVVERDVETGEIALAG